MSPVEKFLLFVFCLATFVGSIATMPLWLDRAIVAAMRRLHIFAFPNAIRLAVSLERDAAQWTFSRYEAKHPTIGTISYLTGPSGLHVEFPNGARVEYPGIQDMVRWDPNWIERRIL